jgi:hypothetical protein
VSFFIKFFFFQKSQKRSKHLKNTSDNPQKTPQIASKSPRNPKNRLKTPQKRVKTAQKRTWTARLFLTLTDIFSDSVCKSRISAEIDPSDSWFLIGKMGDF